MEHSQLFNLRPTFYANLPPSPTETDVLCAIIRELRIAEERHPNYPTDRFRQLAILTEEIGEVAMAVNDIENGHDTVEHLREELLQSAAMCVRMLLNL